MALLRNLLLMTFDEQDARDDKIALLKQHLDKGYMIIAETKINDTGEVKEWILCGPVKYGKITSELPKSKVTNLFEFDPSRGVDG